MEKKLKIEEVYEKVKIIERTKSVKSDKKSLRILFFKKYLGNKTK